MFKGFLHQVTAFVAAFLMLGGLIFWPIVIPELIDEFAGQMYTQMASTTSTAPTAGPSITATYAPIPTVPSDDGGYPPPVADTATPAETPQPTDQPTATMTPSSEPTALPTDTPLPTMTSTATPTAAPVLPLCPVGNTVLMVEGESTLPHGTALSLLYDGTHVGGGTVKYGWFRIPVTQAPDVKGQHEIVVVKRGSEHAVNPETVQHLVCTVQ